MRICIPIGMALALAASAPAVVDKNNLTETEAQEIVAKFAAKEGEFARARESYTYRQTVRIQEVGQTGGSGGRFEVVSDIIFNPDGRRTERVVRAPVPTLQRIQLTPEDEQDLRNVQPFVLTSKEIDKYHIRFLGHEKLDEIPCFTFAVKPKQMEAGQRYFQGIVWVDDRDLQIVKTYGRGVGVQKKGYENLFPKFETYREQIDGRFWFPTYTIANDTLMFSSGPVGIRMSVKYEDYKQFGSDVKIIFGDPVDQQPQAEEPKKP